jgi:ABC-2 type transport system ATP-binding protein
MDEAERCERIGFMQGGHLLEIDSPASFKSRYPHEVVELACEDRPRARSLILKDTSVKGVEIFGDKMHVKIASAEEALPRLRQILLSAGIEVHVAKRVAPSVEDVFLYLARGIHD